MSEGHIVSDGNSSQSDGYVQLPKSVLSRPDLSITGKVVYAAIVGHMYRRSVAWPGIRKIQEASGLKTRRPISRAIKELETLGLLAVERGKRPGHAQGNVYRLPITGAPKTPVTGCQETPVSENAPQEPGPERHATGSSKTP
jgi:hypothetical protein